MAERITQIYRYPVKSMGGQTLDRAYLGEWGIPGDRAWTVKDEERGGIKGGKRFPELMAMHARFLDEPSEQTPSPHVEITLPDDTTITSTDADVATRLSEAVGSPLSLWPLLPKEQLDHYRRSPAPPGTDIEASLRETFARTTDEPLPDLSAFPKELFEYESPPGTYFDAYPILLITTGAIETLTAQSDSDSQYDIRRFRPNLMVESQNGFIENTWVGKKIRIGSAVIQIEMPCPRCVMTTHGFRDLAKDPKVMRELVKQNDGNLGVYCTIIEPGEISAGDTLQFLSD